MSTASEPSTASAIPNDGGAVVEPSKKRPRTTDEEEKVDASGLAPMQDDSSIIEGKDEVPEVPGVLGVTGAAVPAPIAPPVVVEPQREIVYGNKVFTDLTLVAGKDDFLVDRPTMARTSNYYVELFQKHPNHATRIRSVLDNHASAETLKTFLDLVYESENNVIITGSKTTDQLLDVVKLAHYLKAPKILAVLARVINSRAYHSPTADQTRLRVYLALLKVGIKEEDLLSLFEETAVELANCYKYRPAASATQAWKDNVALLWKELPIETAHKLAMRMAYRASYN